MATVDRATITGIANDRGSSDGEFITNDATVIFGSSAVEMKQIAFIDCAVADIETLRAGLRPGIEAVMLSSRQAAPRQIAIAMQGRCDVEAIHIIAHGQPGEVSFGAGALSLETIEEHRSHLAEIGRALAADGEIRLWVCDAARGQRGAAFLTGLRLATGAAVLGATGLVGAAARGGDGSLTRVLVARPSRR